MRIVKIQIDNILGIEHLEIPMTGPITYIEGGNGAGKTSAIEALKFALGGGHDATLLRKGAKEGRAVLILDEGTEITGRVTEERSQHTVKDPRFGVIAKPQGYLDKLANSLSVNPVSFLTAAPKQRAAALLDALHVIVSDEDLTTAGVPAIALPPTSANGLERIEKARKTIYDERTGVNRTAKEKRATITQLEGTLPAGADDTDPSAEATAASQEAALLNHELGNRLEAIRLEESAKKDGINAWADGKIKEVEAKRRERLEVIGTESNDKRAAASAEIGPKIDEVNRLADVANERARRYAADQQSRTFIREHGEAVVALEENSSSLTAALEALEALKTKALANLPIKDVVVRDGEIYVTDKGEELPFDRVNHARQIRVALNVARLLAGQLGIVCLDGIECLEPASRDLLEKGMEKSGLQGIMTRVTEGPLTVRTPAIGG